MAFIDFKDLSVTINCLIKISVQAIKFGFSGKDYFPLNVHLPRTLFQQLFFGFLIKMDGGFFSVCPVQFTTTKENEEYCYFPVGPKKVDIVL